MELTQEYLQSILAYDPLKGTFVWKSPHPMAKRLKAGDPAGHINIANGYLQICINLKRYAAHRLAWLYAYGELPAGEIDHINRNRLDNRIANLRLVTRAENNRNRASWHIRK